MSVSIWMLLVGLSTLAAHAIDPEQCTGGPPHVNKSKLNAQYVAHRKQG